MTSQDSYGIWMDRGIELIEAMQTITFRCAHDDLMLSRGLYTPVYELQAAISLFNAVAYSSQLKHSRVTTSHVRVTRLVV